MKKIYFILIALFISVQTFAQSYSGGSGTSGAPYLIANKTDLKYLTENSGEWSKYFQQTADITFADADFQSGGDFYNGDSRFIPIGTESTKFTGSYVGDGHRISNIKINKSSSNNLRVFGYTNSCSEIKNLGIENIDISCGTNSGGMIGRN